RRVIASEPDLKTAVERATRLRTALRTLGREPVPRSLTERLLEIGRRAARDRAPHGVWSWASAAGAAAIVALAMLELTGVPARRRDERSGALSEFELALSYLHRSHAIAGEHVRRRMERELADALWPRRDSSGVAAEREGNGG